MPLQYSIFIKYILELLVGLMTHHIKIFTAKPADLNLIHETQMLHTQAPFPNSTKYKKIQKYHQKLRVEISG